jgi:hypothetical protein
VRGPASLLSFLALFCAVSATAASPQDCAPCHPAQTARFAESGMARALQAGAGNLRLTGKLGAYSYNVANSVYTVSDGVKTLRFPIAWSFGEGSTGQTWLFRRGGIWQESRVSYFSQAKGLDLTIGQQPPQTLDEAAGRPVPAAEAGRCFNCHATGETPGIQCEHCHGATEQHLKNSAAVPARLGELSTEEMSDFCGQCHRTWSQISIGGPRGVQNVRFQPYRLANSKCYDAADARIRCTACHNPHLPLETNLSAYDAKCQACHAASAHTQGKTDCVTCHMPRVELPGAHSAFTDHRIRVVRGNAYPD